MAIQPVDLGRVLMNVQALRAMKQQAGTEALQSQYLQQRMDQGAQTFAAQQQDEVARQRLNQLSDVHGAAAAVVADPGQFSRVQPLLAKAGYTGDGSDPVELQKHAKAIYDATGAEIFAHAHPMGDEYTLSKDQVRVVDGKVVAQGPSGTEPGDNTLHAVVGDDGKPVLLPTPQAKGKTPYNASVFGAANMTDQALQFAADTYRTTGKMPSTLGRNPAMQAKVFDKIAQDSLASGDTAGSINARSSALKGYQQAFDQTAKMESASKGFLGTIDRNADSLLALKGKVDSSGVPLLNKAVRAWQQGVVGDKDVATYVTYLTSIQGEFAKLKSGSLGNVAASDAAQRDAADTINKFMSEQGIEGALVGIKQEGQNRLAALAETKQGLLQQLGQGAPGAASGSAQQPSPAASPAPASTVAPQGSAPSGQAPEGTVITDGSRTLIKRGGQWVPQ